MVRGEIETAVLLAGLEIFGIGLVDHQQHIARQSGMEPLDLGAGQAGPGGIVRIGEEHHAGALGHRGQQRIDIRAVIGVGRFHRGRAAAPCSDVVNREAVAAEQDLVARTGKALRGEIEQFVRARTANDMRRIDAVLSAQRSAQCGGIGIGIGRGGMIHGQRRQRVGAAPQRVLVCRQFDQLAPVGTGRFARDIGMDAFDPGLHDGCVCHFSFAA